MCDNRGMSFPPHKTQFYFCVTKGESKKCLAESKLAFRDLFSLIWGSVGALVHLVQTLLHVILTFNWLIPLSKILGKAFSPYLSFFVCHCRFLLGMECLIHGMEYLVFGIVCQVFPSIFFIFSSLFFRSEKMRRLKRPSDANAAQSHQRDPTFVTPPLSPPPLYTFFCVALHGIAWFWMVLDGIPWYCMVLHDFECYCMVFNVIPHLSLLPHFTTHLASNFSSYVSVFTWKHSFHQK